MDVDKTGITWQQRPDHVSSSPRFSIDAQQVRDPIGRGKRGYEDME
jgi:hypothetical protein